MHNLTQRLRSQAKRLPVITLIIVAFGILGIWLYGSGDASSYFTGAEAEQGIVAGNAEKVTDSGASGGQAILFQEGPAQGPDCTVDLNDGASLQSALSEAQAGSVICLAPNATYEGAIDVRNGGIAGSPIIVTSKDPTRRASINGRIVFHKGANNVTLSHLNLHDTESGLPSPTIGSENISLISNDITNEHSAICINVIDDAAYGTGRNTIIDRNRIHDCGKLPATNYDHGIYLSGIGARVTNNYIYGNADRGIQLRGARESVIQNNIIDDNGSGIIFGDLAASDNTVRHNIFTNANVRWNVESHWGSEGEGTGNAFSENCVWTARSGSYGQNNGIMPDISGVTLTGNTFSNPQYMDAATRNYALAGNSPCKAYAPQP